MFRGIFIFAGLFCCLTVCGQGNHEIKWLRKISSFSDHPNDTFGYTQTAPIKVDSGRYAFIETVDYDAFVENFIHVFSKFDSKPVSTPLRTTAPVTALAGGNRIALVAFGDGYLSKYTLGSDGKIHPVWLKKYPVFITSILSRGNNFLFAGNEISSDSTSIMEIDTSGVVLWEKKYSIFNGNQPVTWKLHKTLLSEYPDGSILISVIDDSINTSAVAKISLTGEMRLLRYWSSSVTSLLAGSDGRILLGTVEGNIDFTAPKDTGQTSSFGEVFVKPVVAVAALVHRGDKLLTAITDFSQNGFYNGYVLWYNPYLIDYKYESGVDIDKFAGDKLFYPPSHLLVDSNIVFVTGTYGKEPNGFWGSYLAMIKSETSSIMPQWQKKSIDFRLYPNPAKDFITIDYNLENSTNLAIDLYDAQGRILESLSSGRNQGGDSQNYDVSQLPKGLYLVRINTTDGVATRKFIKL